MDHNASNNYGKVNRTTSKKCKCSFSITIFLNNEDDSWYVKKKRLFYVDPTHHQNHIWVSPNHLSLNEHTPPGLVLQCIDDLILTGINIPNIQLYIKKCHGFQTLL